ncbi:hypothetical protein CONPUDRAFT_169478 [Coniophora puteana RWD-64-598 SS2]|uniref:DUF6532 domain-containing protein n=1 Tax=Coniophora puteana (strain RWD-64-598) TaxID=741705 RepID=A0A5M3MA80_CONPW|nr:uncharacterized protein CONPUDRAFT_169478 [Coniophora puteana RWD-64-598 SS2]EIW75744.1 hypothetical protein CONPUDRAFT_169478 [Coniophora puteana RWD-64-598 SS2]
MARPSHSQPSSRVTRERNEGIDASSVVEGRTRTNRKASNKKEQQYRDEIDSQKEKIAKLQRMLQQTSREHDSDEESEHDLNRPESEEEDPPPHGGAFSSNFATFRQRTESVPPSPPHKRLRRYDEARQADAGGAAAPINRQEDTNARAAPTRTVPTPTPAGQQQLPDRIRSPTGNAVDISPDPIPPPLKPGVNGDSVTKGKCSDYKAPASDVILRGIRDYEARVLGENPFPSAEDQYQWAIDAIGVANRENRKRNAGRPVPTYEATDRVVHVIKIRHSHARGHLLDPTRMAIVNQFGVKKSPANKSEAAKNLRRVDWLLTDNRYTLLHQDRGVGLAMHPILIDIVADGLLRKTSSGALLSTKYFRPISLRTIALMFTVIHFCLREYRDGDGWLSQAKKFSVDDTNNKTVYEDKLERLHQWDQLDPNISRMIRTNIFDQAYFMTQHEKFDDGSQPAGLLDSEKEAERTLMREYYKQSLSSGEASSSGGASLPEGASSSDGAPMLEGGSSSGGAAVPEGASTLGTAPSPEGVSSSSEA